MNLLLSLFALFSSLEATNHVSAASVWKMTVFANNTPPGALDMINPDEVLNEFLSRKKNFFRLVPGQVIPKAAGTAGCCSHDYAQCVTWCGTTESTCGSCNAQENFRWLAAGAVSDCMPRWSDCTTTGVRTCCPGLVCRVQNPYYSQCLP